MQIKHQCYLLHSEQETISFLFELNCFEFEWRTNNQMQKFQRVIVKTMDYKRNKTHMNSGAENGF